MIRAVRSFALMALLLSVLGACASAPRGPEVASQAQINALADHLLALGPNVDPEEAARAAEIAYRHTYALSQSYGITDPPLIHNTKVNMGLRPRGLCWHWAEDIENRLAEEEFQTLTLHRAIANADNPFRIDHSTAILSAAGETMFEGTVLDPWRYGGRLHWAEVRADTDYDWVPQAEAHDIIRARLIREGKRSTLE